MSATSTNARLFRMEDRIGCVREGMDADLIAVGGNPIDDIDLLTDSDNVRLVVKGGKICKQIV